MWPTRTGGGPSTNTSILILCQDTLLDTGTVISAWDNTQTTCSQKN